MSDTAATVEPETAETAERTPAEVVDGLLEVLAAAGHEPAMVSASPEVFDAIKVTTPTPAKPSRAKPGAVAKRSAIRITKSTSMPEPSLLLMTVHDAKRYVFTLAHPDGLAAAAALMPAALAAVAEDPTISGPDAMDSARASA